MNNAASKFPHMWKPAIHRGCIRPHVQICGFENTVFLHLGFPVLAKSTWVLSSQQRREIRGLWGSVLMG